MFSLVTSKMVLIFISIQVEWSPYTDISQNVIPEEIKQNLNLGRSKTMLICFDKAERHLPDRCLRQYGMQQPIPEDVLRWERKSRGVDGGIDLSGKMESELSEWFGRRLNIVEGDEAIDDSEYMQWYSRITRKLVGRPIPISSEFQRMVNLCLDLLSATPFVQYSWFWLGIPTFKGDITIFCLFLMYRFGKLQLSKALLLKIR